MSLNSRYWYPVTRIHRASG